MAKRDLKDWALHQLLAELRHRERRGRRSAAKERAAAPSPSLHAPLRSVATGRLARHVQDRQRVIYGVDNRVDLYRLRKPRVLKRADSVAALVRASDLTRNDSDGTYTLATRSYQAEYDLCGSESFASQRLGCFCTGFLVARDVIATAGHCVKSPADLARTRFVFGFRMIDRSTAQTTFPAADVYAGASIIGRQMSDDGTDWALVRLERPVAGRRPLRARKSGKVPDRAPLFVIGHPNGLPTKFADGAAVRDNSPRPYFVANLDTYGGNSGSPVFNARTLTVEGILVRGENDFVSNGSCNISLVCPTTGCRGEDVTRSPVWTGKVPKRANRSRRRAPRRGRKTRR
jgi:V8-like Glu-specific endopeptidase